MSVNKVMLIGNLGSDPEVKSVGKNHVVNVDMATTSKFTDSSGNRLEKTEWHKLVVWGRLAQNLAQYCKKGTLVHAEGRLETQKWTDKEGVDRWTTQIVTSNIQFLGNLRARPTVQEPVPVQLQEAA